MCVLQCKRGGQCDWLLVISCFILLRTLVIEKSKTRVRELMQWSNYYVLLAFCLTEVHTEGHNSLNNYFNWTFNTMTVNIVFKMSSNQASFPAVSSNLPCGHLYFVLTVPLWCINKNGPVQDLHLLLSLISTRSLLLAQAYEVSKGRPRFVRGDCVFPCRSQTTGSP